MRNTYLQFTQFITGILIAVLLGIHLVNMHLDAILNFLGVKTFFGVDITHDPTVFALMMERAQSITFAAIYIALLVFTLFHAFNGLRNVLLELTKTPGAGKAVIGVLIFIGIVFLVLGIYAPLTLLS